MYISSSLVGLPVLIHLVSGQLHTTAKNAGLLYFGTETEGVSFGDALYQAALKNTSDFGQITPGNSMKWDSIEPQPGQFSFAAGDSIADLAKTNNQLLHCHNLVWHQQLPAWVTSGNWTRITLTAALQNHITTEVTHYKTLGNDYIRTAFETAAAADSSAKLYYNDFNTEFPGVKSTAAQAIVGKLKAANVKIDGVGFQAHFIVGGTPSMASQVTNLEAFTALGVEVAVIELDIKMTMPTTDALLSQQKTDYQTTTAACLAVKNCVGVTVWGSDDKYSWIPSTIPTTGAGCLFDETVTRKPAYFGALAAFNVTPGNNSLVTGTSSSAKNGTQAPNDSPVNSPPLKVGKSEAPSISFGAVPVILGSLAFAILLS